MTMQLILAARPISEWADIFITGLSTLLLDREVIEKFIIEAACEYQAWGSLSVDKSEFNAETNLYETTEARINSATVLTPSEWGIIKPLVNLFVERENALMQESTRVLSHEPYGRNSSEVEADIQNFRNEWFRKEAFSAPIISI